MSVCEPYMDAVAKTQEEVEDSQISQDEMSDFI